jgi:response regulator RpfG family c-di-GMP phosphodiesterase
MTVTRNAAQSLPDTPLDSARIEACLDHVCDTLGSLASVAALEEDQRDTVRDAVRALLDRRAELVDDFAHAFTLRELQHYRAAHRSTGQSAPGDAAIDDRTVDEALHYYALLQLAEACEAGSAGHLQRTAAYCRVFAEALGCEPLFVDDLCYAAQLHDIGLIAVPKEILEQRGRIENYQQVLLDTHTRAGAFLVNGVIDRLQLDDGPLVAAHEVVLYHHERHDGLGVLGLSGEAIPYPARVFLFADAYDALRRPRPYREALGHDAAVEAIQSANRPGVEQFDPALLDTFLDCAPEVGWLFDRLTADHPT